MPNNENWHFSIEKPLSMDPNELMLSKLHFKTNKFINYNNNIKSRDIIFVLLM